MRHATRHATRHAARHAARSPISRALLAAALVLPAAHAAPVATATTERLAPQGMRVVRGEASLQGVAALATSSLTGRTDAWADYVEFTPGRGGFVATFDYEASTELAARGLAAASVELNYRGPTRAEQRWTLQARNARTNRWVRVADNAGMPDWRWRAARVELPGDADDWIDALGRTRLRWSTPGGGDASQLDALTVSLKAAAPDADQPPAVPPVTDGIWTPAPGTSWQWQLTGAIDRSVDVAMYDIDLFTTSAATIGQLHDDGRTVICYFSAGSFEDFRPDAARFPAAVKGRTNGWEGERWLDIRRIDALAPIMRARLDLAVTKGCDGVEPDNVDGYAGDNDSGFPLTAGDQFAFNVWIAQESHARGLSVGLKNDLDQIVELEPYFDWALNEQCAQYGECETLSPFVENGKAVFGVEYKGDLGRFCSVTNALDFDWLYKNLELDAAREACR